MLEKHKSKLLKGFEKQVARQNRKESKVKIKLPVAVNLPKNFSKNGKYKHHIVVRNSKWNGMNLKNIRNSFYIIRVGGMYGKFTIDSNGMYKLSRYGKQLLNKKRQRNLENNIKPVKI